MENRPTLTQFIIESQSLHQGAAVILSSRNEIERIAVYHASPNKAAA